MRPETLVYEAGIYSQSAASSPPSADSVHDYDMEISTSIFPSQSFALHPPFSRVVLSMPRPVKYPSFAVSSKKRATIEVAFCASGASLLVVPWVLVNLEPDEELPRLLRLSGVV
jgi:hypothetical protein